MASDLGKDPGALSRSLAGLKGKAEAIARADSRTIRAAGLELERAIKLELSKPGSGELYTHGKVTHQASAPGEPPAPDTGALRNSVGQEVVGNALRIGVGMPYAPFLEFGTIGEGGFIAPRPFMRPALAAARERMTGVVVSEVRKGMP